MERETRECELVRGELVGDLTTQRLRSPDKKLPVLLTYRLLQRGEEVVGFLS